MNQPIINRATFRSTLGQGADGERLNRLATLSNRAAPEGVVLLAEVSNEPVAAIGLFDRRTVSDPDRSTFALRMRLRMFRLQLRLIVAVVGL
jgi:hypothetical protein